METTFNMTENNDYAPNVASVVIGAPDESMECLKRRLGKDPLTPEPFTPKEEMLIEMIFKEKIPLYKISDDFLDIYRFINEFRAFCYMCGFESGQPLIRLINLSMKTYMKDFTLKSWTNDDTSSITTEKICDLIFENCMPKNACQEALKVFLQNGLINADLDHMAECGEMLNKYAKKDEIRAARRCDSSISDYINRRIDFLEDKKSLDTFMKDMKREQTEDTRNDLLREEERNKRKEYYRQRQYQRSNANRRRRNSQNRRQNRRPKQG
ncbi:hypothetical protein B5S32_g3477 [[Candida] boidinii]|nr:hypothetical protein B5S32_g3477 [[Candida] boidinii]